MTVSQKTKYEVMAIITNAIDEKSAQNQTQESLIKKIKEAGGNITFEDFWGERGFAYKIKKQKWGYYFVTQFEIAPEKIQELKREWNIDNKIVRFLITKVQKNAPVPRRYEDIKKEWEATEKERKIAEIEKPKRTKKIAEEKDIEAEETPKTTKKTENTISQEKKEKIDKTLDKILEDSSIDL